MSEPSNKPRISHQRPYRTPGRETSTPPPTGPMAPSQAEISYGQANVESFKAGRKSLKEASLNPVGPREFFQPGESVGVFQGGDINWEFCWEGSFVLAWMELWVESASYFVIIVGMSRST